MRSEGEREKGREKGISSTLEPPQGRLMLGPAHPHPTTECCRQLGAVPSSPTLMTSWSTVPTATDGERQRWGRVASPSPCHLTAGKWQGQHSLTLGASSPVPPPPVLALLYRLCKAQGPKEAGRALWLLWLQGQLSQLLEIARSDVGEGISSALMVSYALSFGADSLAPPRASSASQARGKVGLSSSSHAVLRGGRVSSVCLYFM